MLSLLERNIAVIEKRLVLLAPPAAAVPAVFRNITVDSSEHAKLVREMQRLRGAIYLDDGALERRQLSRDGLHQAPEDKQSWHLLMRDANGQLSSCAWYLLHENATSIRALRARKCPLGQDATSSRVAFERAIQSELDRARGERLGYAELGGWAVAKTCRCTSEALLLAFGAYSLSRALGGALGLTTATVRHSSSAILRRLGGSYLQVDGEVVGPYYDPNYRCEMELLRFDSRRPSAKYVGLIDRVQARLANVTVFASHSAAARQFSNEAFGPLVAA